MAVCVEGDGVIGRNRRRSFLRPLGIQRDIRRDGRGEVKGVGAGSVPIPSAEGPAACRGIGGLSGRLAAFNGLRSGSRAVAVAVKGDGVGSGHWRGHAFFSPTGINGDVACDRRGELISRSAFFVLAPAGKCPTRIGRWIGRAADRVAVLHRNGSGRRTVAVAVKGDGMGAGHWRGYSAFPEAHVNGYVAGRHCEAAGFCNVRFISTYRNQQDRVHNISAFRCSGDSDCLARFGCRSRRDGFAVCADSHIDVINGGFFEGYIDRYIARRHDKAGGVCDKFFIAFRPEPGDMPDHKSAVRHCFDRDRCALLGGRGRGDSIAAACVIYDDLIAGSAQSGQAPGLFLTAAAAGTGLFAFFGGRGRFRFGPRAPVMAESGPD